VKPERVTGIMTQLEWDMLANAERRLYANTGAPTYGWTDVNVRNESWMMKQLWDYTYDCVEASYCDKTHEARQHMTAYRVAQAMAVMVFGAEFLLR
jgi:hypothetical protein